MVRANQDYRPGKETKYFHVPAGLYTYEQLSKFLIEEIPTLMLSINS